MEQVLHRTITLTQMRIQVQVFIAIRIIKHLIGAMALGVVLNSISHLNKDLRTSRQVRNW